jgi:hypothetical protein
LEAAHFIRFPVVGKKRAENGSITGDNVSYACGVGMDKKFDLLAKII